MTKTIMYTYLGTNGTICSSVHLEDIYYTRKVHMTADLHKILTKDGVTGCYQITVPEEEADDWYEIDYLPGQK
jgi:hypothetical protein